MTTNNLIRILNERNLTTTQLWEMIEKTIDNEVEHKDFLIFLSNKYYPVGVTKANIYNLKNGKIKFTELKLSTVCKIAYVLHVSLDELCGFNKFTRTW